MTPLLALFTLQDDKEKDRMKASLTGAILAEKPNVKVWADTQLHNWRCGRSVMPFSQALD